MELIALRRDETMKEQRMEEELKTVQDIFEKYQVQHTDEAMGGLEENMLKRRAMSQLPRATMNLTLALESFQGNGGGGGNES